MAARVNTRFLIVLLVGIGSAVVIIGGLWFLKVRSDASRHARLGDEQMRLAQQVTEFDEQQECYRAAHDYYERAVGKEPNDFEYVDKLQAALLSMHPTTADEARQFYMEYVAILSHKVDHDPLNAARHRSRSGAPPVWQMLYDSAGNMWDALPASEPERIWAKFYRGAAQFDPRMHDLLVPEDPTAGTQLEQGERNLLEFLEAHPDSDAGWGALLSGELAIIGRLHIAGQATRVQEELQKVRARLDQARAQVTEGPETIAAALRLAMYDRAEAPALVDPEALRADAQELISRTREADDPAVVTETVEILRRLGPLEGVPEPVAIVDDYLEKHPLAYDIRFTKANLHYLSGELEEGEESARMVVKADWLPVGFLSQYQGYLRQAAASLLVDIAHARWSAAEESEKPRLVSETEAARDELARLIPAGERDSDVMLMRADAKLAYARRDDERAAALFDRLARDEMAEDVEILWYAARCLERIGQVGRALEHVGEALMIQPTNPEILVMAVRLSLRVRDYEAAADAGASLLEATAEEENPRITAAATALREHNFVRVKDLLDALIEAEPKNPAVILGAEVATQALTASGGGAEDPVGVALDEAQAALDDGEADAATAMLRAALNQSPDDLRLLNALVRVCMASGQEDEAKQYLQRAEELAPGSPIFRNLALAIETPDPIERLKRRAELNEADEAQQALDALVSLHSLAMREEESAQQFEQQGRTEEAQDARALAARARREESAYREQVEQLAPDDPRFVEYRFSTAVLSEDWETAEQLVADVLNPAEPIYNADQAQGALFQGRLLLAKEQFADAARVLRQAGERIPYNAEMWRMLAVAYQQVGNVSEAVNAYERAYANNPNDIRTVGLYVDALRRSGDPDKALQVVKKGRQLVPRNEQMWSQWLLLEAEVGDRAIVLRERRQRYKEHPEDAANAVALASLLVRTEPSYELVLDEDGKAVYTHDRWLRTPHMQRQTTLQELKQQWFDEADQIVEQLGADGQRDQRWHLLKADLLRARGEVDAGEEVLRSFAEAQTDTASRLESLLTLAQYQAQVNRAAKALKTFDEARQYQGEDREADYLMGQFLFSRSRFEEAAERFESVLETRDNRTLGLQLVQCFVNLHRFDDARRRLDAIVQADGPDLMTFLLEAAIVGGEADELWVAGRKEEAQQKYAARTEILERASDLDPMNPRPYVERARGLYNQARRTGNPVLFDDALRSLVRADEVQADFPDTGHVRVAILLARDNRVGAINELKRMIERRPSDIDLRLRLVALLVDAERVSEAVQVAGEVVRMDPASVSRREMLGDLYRLHVKDPRAAAEEYSAALQFTSSSRIVRKLAESLMAEDPPDHGAALDLIERYPQELETDPVLQAVYAVALAADGRFEEGRAQMREAYALHRRYIEDGTESPDAIADWYMRLGRLFVQTEDVEKFVMDVTGGNLGPREYFALALFWRSSGREGLGRTVELLRAGTEVCPPDDVKVLAKLYTELGLTLLLTEDVEAAVEAYERVVELEPDNAAVLNNLAYALSEMLGAPERALPYAQRAADLASGNASIIDTLGWVQYQLGAYDEAEASLRRSLQLEDAATTHYHLASVYHKKGDRRRAERHLQRAVELKPDPDTQAKINRLANDIRTRRGEGQ
jgi:tetratricopeptide (TPR) repeat protein